jgi:hypothetical protein
LSGTTQQQFETLSPKTTTIYQSKYFVLCTDVGVKDYIQPIRASKYMGVNYHTAVWLEEGIDTNGKRVCVKDIGCLGRSVNP